MYVRIKIKDVSYQFQGKFRSLFNFPSQDVILRRTCQPRSFKIKNIFMAHNAFLNSANLIIAHLAKKIIKTPD